MPPFTYYFARAFVRHFLPIVIDNVDCRSLVTVNTRFSFLFTPDFSREKSRVLKKLLTPDAHGPLPMPVPFTIHHRYLYLNYLRQSRL